jgi:hypothetical protein
VKALDGVAVAALLPGLFVLLFGGLVIGVPPLEIQLRHPWGALFVAGSAFAIRHAAHPDRPLPGRIRHWLRASSGGFASVVGGALATRVAVLLVAYAAVLLVGNVRPGFRVSRDPLVDLPARYDAGWYVAIAQDGYAFQGRFDRQQTVAFFPAFPILMRAAGVVVGAEGRGVPDERREGRLLWAGTLVSILAFAWAMTYVVRVTRDAGGGDSAVDAAALLSAYPFAVFFSAPYSESVFLLASLAAFYYYRREQWIAAGAWGLLVGLTRPNGCFLSIVLALLLVEQVRASGLRDRLAARLAAAAMPGAGMLAYSAYIKHLTGEWFGWARVQEAWGRSYAGVDSVAGGATWAANQGLIRALTARPVDALNGAALVFVLIMLWPVWRRLGPAWAALILVSVVPPLLAGGLMSMGRITATIFPVFIALAMLLPKRAMPPTLTAFATAQGLAAVLFFTWRPLF